MTRAKQELPMTQEEKDKIKRIKEAKKLLKRMLTPKTEEQIEEEIETKRFVEFAKQINPFEDKSESGYRDIPENFSLWSKDDRKDSK